MKVLVATNENQGMRAGDFDFCDEGELVKFGFQCSSKEKAHKCGCDRSLVGFDTLKATTTFKVVDKPISPVQYERLLKESEDKAGWKYGRKPLLP